MTYDIIIDGKAYRLELTGTGTGWDCRLNGREVKIDAVLARRDVLSIIIGGKAYEIKRERTASDLHLWIGSGRYDVQIRDPRSLRGRGGTNDDKGPRKLVAPMPGKVVRVLAAQDTEVEAGQGLLVVEAMKMQNEIRSPKKGVVRKMVAVPGANVNAGDVLAIVE
jgi:biotin carboxyl carrier protein